MYVQLIADQLNTIFIPEIARKRMNAMADPMEKYIVTHATFSRQITSVAAWRAEITKLGGYFDRRPPYYEPAQQKT